MLTLADISTQYIATVFDVVFKKSFVDILMIIFVILERFKLKFVHIHREKKSLALNLNYFPNKKKKSSVALVLIRRWQFNVELQTNTVFFSEMESYFCLLLSVNLKL